MRIHRRPLCLAIGSVLTLAVFGDRFATAQTDPPMITVLGATDGQIKILADTAQVGTTLVIESVADKAVAASVRVSPFRDAAGRLHPANVTIGEGAKPDTSSTGKGTKLESAEVTSLSFSLPPYGSTELRIGSTLVSEGEYVSEVVVVSEKRRDRLRLIVTRASRDLSVEIQGVDVVQGTAVLLGPSTGELRFTLLEKLGRNITLNPIVLTKLTRKASNGVQVQAPYRLQVGGQPPESLKLSPNQPLNVVLAITDLAGAGDYAGTVRISAPGSKPVDQDFTLAVREPRMVAFVAILIGVLLSAMMRWLAETYRPRLVETRRARLLVRELDELLADRTSQREESDVLRVLRRETVAAEVALDLDATDRVKTRLDRIEERRRLAAEWIVRRRHVEALKPDSLRDRFRPVVDGTRDVIIAESATGEQIATARTTLSGLNSQIDNALQEELTKRIDSLRKNLDALSARPTSQLAIVAPAALRGMLEEAEQEKRNLRHSLAVYERAHRAWTSFLLDDLAEVADGAAPFGLEDAAWTDLAGRLKSELAEARRVLSENPDAAVYRYNAAWAQYVATVSEALRRKLETTHQKVEESKDLSDQQRNTALRAVEEAVTANQEARTAIATGQTQAAVGTLSRALERAADAQQSAERRTRSVAATDFVTARPSAVDVAPFLVDGRGDAVIVPERMLAITQRTIDRIDMFVLLVATLVATVLGLTVLWTPKPSWGGWDDRIVAVLWGLGLHQFTFTGLAGVADRLRGGQPAGRQS